MNPADPTPPPVSDPDRIVCKCLSVTERVLRKMMRKSDHGDLEKFSRRTSVGRQCGSCRGEVGQMLAEFASESAKAPGTHEARLPAMHVARVWLHRVHLYFSLAACLLLLFFSITGFVMNHPGAFGLDEVSARTVSGSVPQALCQEPDSGLLLAKLRPFGIRGDVLAFDPGEETLEIETRSLGQSAVITVERATGRFEASLQESGWLPALAALHRGEQAGSQGGSRFLDLAALMLLIVGAGGLALFMVSPGVRRPLATLTLILGALGLLVVVRLGW
jgi:uncharacterized protein